MLVECHLVTEFPPFRITHRFIEARCRTIYWPRWVTSTTSHLFRYILILSSSRSIKSFRSCISPCVWYISYTVSFFVIQWLLTMITRRTVICFSFVTGEYWICISETVQSLLVGVNFMHWRASACWSVQGMASSTLVVYSVNYTGDTRAIQMVLQFIFQSSTFTLEDPQLWYIELWSLNSISSKM